MALQLKQVLVIGGLVAGAFGVATLLNGKRRKRRAHSCAAHEPDPAQCEENAGLEPIDAEGTPAP